MQVAGVLGAVVAAALVFLLQNLFEVQGPKGDMPIVLRYVSALSLFLATSLYLTTLFFYDRLMMPPRYWNEGELKRSKRSTRLVRRPPSSATWVVYQNMTRIWSWFFNSACGFLLLGVMLLGISLFEPRSAPHFGWLSAAFLGGCMVPAAFVWVGRPRLRHLPVPHPALRLPPTPSSPSPSTVGESRATLRLILVGGCDLGGALAGPGTDRSGPLSTRPGAPPRPPAYYPHLPPAAVDPADRRPSLPDPHPRAGAACSDGLMWAPPADTPGGQPPDMTSSNSMLALAQHRVPVHLGVRVLPGQGQLDQPADAEVRRGDLVPAVDAAARRHPGHHHREAPVRAAAPCAQLGRTDGLD